MLSFMAAVCFLTVGIFSRNLRYAPESNRSGGLFYFRLCALFAVSGIVSLLNSK